MSSSNKAESRLGIYQLGFDVLPKTRGDGATGYEVDAFAKNALKPIRKRHETEADFRIDFDDNVDVACGRRVAAGMRAKQRDPVKWKFAKQREL